MAEIQGRPWQTAGPLAVLVLLSSVVYGYRLGDGGFVNTEGHRVYPAWEMLDRGDFLGQRLFGQLYFRKPPGHAWAVAATGAWLGRSEWSARLVGAVAGLAMVLASYVFARRWFGPSGAFAAGMSQLLCPLFFKYQRSAEIEGLLHLFSQLAVLLIIDLLLDPDRPRWARALRATLAGLAILGGLLVKGPAIGACVAGAALSACGTKRRWGTLINGEWWSAVAGAVLVAALSATILVNRVQASGEEVVTQAIGHFNKSYFDWVELVTMIPSALIQALPTSLLIFAPMVWRSDDARRRQRATCVALTSAITVLLFAGVGLSNPRYAMPATTFVSVLMGYAYAEASLARGLPTERRWWLPTLRTLCCCLLVLWFGHVAWLEPRTRSTSGVEMGRRLAEVLPDGSTVLADELVEARPETLGSMQDAGARLGKQIAVRWVPGLACAGRVNEGDFVALRTDRQEFAEFCDRLGDRGWTEVVRGSVYKYPFVVMKICPIDYRPNLPAAKIAGRDEPVR